MSPLISNELMNEIGRELWALGEYLDMIAQGIPRLANMDKERRSTLAKLFDKANVNSVELTTLVSDYLGNKILPRYIYGSYVVILWSFFEDTLMAISNDDEMQIYTVDVNLTLNDFAGNKLEKALKFWLRGFIDKDQEEALERIYEVRNNVAHAVSGISDGDLKKIKPLLNSGIGLQIVDGKLQVQEAFCRWSLDIISKVLYPWSNYG